MPASKKAKGPTVVRRYQAFGACPELGIHVIPIGSIEVEELSDGTFRMFSDDAPVDETPAEPEQPAEVVPAGDAAPDEQSLEDDAAPELDADPIADAPQQ